jgi:hypothetical protein
MQTTFKLNTTLNAKRKTATIVAGGPAVAARRFAANLGIGPIKPGNGTEFPTVAGAVITVKSK